MLLGMAISSGTWRASRLGAGTAPNVDVGKRTPDRPERIHGMMIPQGTTRSYAGTSALSQPILSSIPSYADDRLRRNPLAHRTNASIGGAALCKPDCSHAMAIAG